MDMTETTLKIPCVSNFDKYVSSVNSLPMLSKDEEMRLFKEYKEQGSLKAVEKIVLSYLRIVPPIAREYSNKHPIEDLVQEGNIALMKAIKNFDPSLGYQLYGLATVTVKRQIQHYTIENWLPVRVVTSKPQRKVFNHIFKRRRELEASEGRRYLTNQDLEDLALELNVPIEDVKEIDVRTSGGIQDIDLEIETEEGEKTFQIAAPDSYEPDKAYAQREISQLLETEIPAAIATLKEREQSIIKARWFQEVPATYYELAEKFGVSYQRIAQIETESLKKIRKLVKNPLQ